MICFFSVSQMERDALEVRAPAPAEQTGLGIKPSLTVLVRSIAVGNSFEQESQPDSNKAPFPRDSKNWLVSGWVQV